MDHRTDSAKDIDIFLPVLNRMSTWTIVLAGHIDAQVVTRVCTSVWCTSALIFPGRVQEPHGGWSLLWNFYCFPHVSYSQICILIFSSFIIVSNLRGFLPVKRISWSSTIYKCLYLLDACDGMWRIDKWMYNLF